MPTNSSQTHPTFSRHVAPFAPLALALLMNATPSASPTQSNQHAGAAAGVFVPACMPYNGQKIPAIDDHCGVQGGSSDPSKQAQSKAKNNLCVATVPSRPITYQGLLDLQAKASAENLKGLADRSPLTQLGEGRYVEYVAFIQDAHYSDVAKGEAVNCNIPGDTTNDIHIVLVQHPTDDPCLSTTAEMIPHFRLSSWTDKNLMAVKQHPVKVHGQLFFDDSHTPCTATSRPNPKRASLWEVHPVYSMQEAKAGSTVTYTVTLKDSRDRAVPTSKDLQLVVETPAGKQTVVLPAGQSSAKFTWQALKSGVTQMTVQSGALHPATGLILVAPPPTTKLIGMKNSSAAGEVARVKPMPQKERGPKPGAAIGAPVGVMAKKAGRAPASEQPVGTAATPVSGPSPTQAVPLEQAKKLKLYITPLPVYGNAIGHIWQASVSVAALNEQDSLVPVAADVSVHFNARLGKISPADIILSAGQLSNFQNPVLLTDDHVGKGSVDVVSSLGPAGPIEVDYLLPPPTRLRIALGSPVLSGTGSSSVTVQICVLDESGGVTSSSEDLAVTLTPSIGQLKSSLANDLSWLILL